MDPDKAMYARHARELRKRAEHATGIIQRALFNAAAHMEAASHPEIDMPEDIDPRLFPLD